MVSFLMVSLFAVPALAQPRDEHRDPHMAPPPPPPPPGQGMMHAAFGPAPNHKETEAEARARAEHEKLLAQQDADREKTREERQRQAREAELARIRNIPPSPLLNEELTRYAQRKAELERIKQIAALQGRADASKRCDELLAKEESRHGAWLSAHPHG